MTPKQRVMAAMNFERPDRTPRYWQQFWPSFVQAWEHHFGPTDLHTRFGDDMRLVAPIESAWPGRAGIVRDEGDTFLARSGWGEIKRLPKNAEISTELMGELVEPAIAEHVDPDTMIFEDAGLDARFTQATVKARTLRDQYFVWCKSGGPYSRLCFMRGESNLWMDVIDDPQWVRAWVERITDHLIAVAIEAMRRTGLQETGIAIYDDVASSNGPFIGPDRYETIFLPAVRRMVRAFKDAGARWVMHHSDGNVLPLLDLWIEAGIDAVNPLEYRCGMDPLAIREQYGRQLILVGGLDNTDILPRGDRAEIKEHLSRLLSLDTGYILGPHSISPDIQPTTMAYVLELLG